MSYQNNLYEKMMYSIFLKDEPNIIKYRNDLIEYLKIVPDKNLEKKLQSQLEYFSPNQPHPVGNHFGEYVEEGKGVYWEHMEDIE